MLKNTIYCSMQDNGFKQLKGRELSLNECKELFNCQENKRCICPCFEIVFPNKDSAKVYGMIEGGKILREERE